MPWSLSHVCEWKSTGGSIVDVSGLVLGVARGVVRAEAGGVGEQLLVGVGPAGDSIFSVKVGGKFSSCVANVDDRSGCWSVKSPRSFSMPR